MLDCVSVTACFHSKEGEIEAMEKAEHPTCHPGVGRRWSVLQGQSTEQEGEGMWRGGRKEQNLVMTFDTDNSGTLKLWFVVTWGAKSKVWRSAMTENTFLCGMNIIKAPREALHTCMLPAEDSNNGHSQCLLCTHWGEASILSNTRADKTETQAWQSPYKNYSETQHLKAQTQKPDNPDLSQDSNFYYLCTNQQGHRPQFSDL